MKIIRNLSQISKNHPALALTIGNFDGVHLGHLEIINQVKKIAKEKKIFSAILTFEPHPAVFFKAKRSQDFRLTSLAQKLRIFKDLGIDYAIIIPFNQKFSNISAQDFAENILLKELQVKDLVIGYDFNFGKNREGNFKMLECLELNLKEVFPIKIHDKTCSSTRVRELISDGDLNEANLILGKNYIKSGLVVQGKKLAREMNFPTANLKTKPHLIKPKFGVYKTETFIPHLNKSFNSITNFGIKPTIDNSEPESLYETHILDFNGDLYGKKIHVKFINFIREEKKFSSFNELKSQIEKDIASLNI